jgi:hypothetical protein
MEKGSLLAQSNKVWRKNTWGPRIYFTYHLPSKVDSPEIGTDMINK